MMGMYLINDYSSVILLVKTFSVFLFINYVIIDIEDGDGGGSGGAKG